MAQDHLHTTHDDIVKRLKRAEGHLATVIKMIGDGRECIDLAQQLHAVEKAIAHSASNDARAARQSIREFKEITKYL
jgi:DNA-binding FrmR family transcriptional regulator